MKKIYLVLLSILLLNLFIFQYVTAQATDLFFSEYAEGSSLDKYLEIYNGTGSTVNLSNYTIWRISNGGVWPEATITLSGNIADGATFIIANGSASPDILSKANMTSSNINHNGDDAYALVKDGTIIDAIGEEGSDPGSGWTVGGTVNATKDHTLIRKSSICSPNTDWTASSASEWDVMPKDDWSNMGTHTANCGAVPVTIAAPAFSLAAGAVDAGTSITLATTTAGAEIFYTLDGSTPTASSIKYTQPIVVTNAVTIKAIAILNGDNSNIPSAAYTIKVVVPLPDAPVANDATNISYNSFTANWSSTDNATSYIIDVAKSPNFGRPVNANGLIISEVIEGGGYNKAVEIYNGTASSVDLSSYALQKDGDGNGSFSTEITLSGTLEPGKVFIISHTSADAAIKDKADVISGSLSFNGDDQIRLVKGGAVIDHVGVPGDVNFNKDKTLIRKETVEAASTTYDEAEWQVMAKDYSDDLDNRSYVANSADLVTGYQNYNAGNKLNLLINNLQSGKAYYYRVKSINATGSSDYSNTIMVETPIDDRIKLAADVSSVEAENLENMAITLSLTNAEFIKDNLSTSTIAFVNAPDGLEVASWSWINSSTLTINVVYNGEDIVQNYNEVKISLPANSNTADLNLQSSLFAIIAPIVEDPNKRTVWYEPFYNPENSTAVWSVQGKAKWDWQFIGNPKGAMVINGYYDTFNESWLVSPRLDFYNLEHLQLVFEHATIYDENKGLHVLISIDYDGVSNPAEQGTWIDLTDSVDFNYLSTWDFEATKNIDLSKYANNEVLIAFKYINSKENRPTWAIDNINVTGIYNENMVVEPQFSIASNTAVKEGATLEITSKTEDAKIFYTLNGEEPDLTSTLYVEPLTITTAIDIKAVAYKNKNYSKIVSASYQIEEEVLPIPDAPIILEATEINNDSFIANWNKSEYADHYFIDVATDSRFEKEDDPVTGEKTLIISEYIEGGSYNKAIELYNCTDESIDLSNYILQKDVNGDNDFKTELALSGTLESKSTFVLCHPKADSPIKSLTDVEDGQVINFNGDDQIRLVKTDGTIVDHVGVSGDVNFAKDKTLVRNGNIVKGNSIWDEDEWTVYEKNTFDYIGKHNIATKSVMAEFYVPGYKNLQLADTSSWKIEVLQEGTYFYRLRAANASGVSKNSNVIEVEIVKQVEIAATFDNLADLRKAEQGKNYEYTGKAVVTYTQDFRNQVYIQDETAAILIDDPENVIQSAYMENDGMTNLKGKLTAYKGMLEFVPLADPGNPYASNVKIDTLKVDFVADLDSAWYADNQARLVTINNFAFNNNEKTQFEVNTIYNFISGSVTSKSYTDIPELKFKAMFYDANYIGQDLPEEQLFLTGLINENDGNFITSRRLSDMQEHVTDAVSALTQSNCIVYQIDNSIVIDNLSVGEKQINVYNLLGQSIYCNSSSAPKIAVAVPKKGVYLLNITDESGGRIIKKIAVK